MEARLAPDTEKTTQNLSLLWPAGIQPRTDRQLADETIRDLALEALVVGMCPYSLHQDAIRAVLYHLCPDPPVLTYRQAILLELLRQREVLDK